MPCRLQIPVLVADGFGVITVSEEVIVSEREFVHERWSGDDIASAELTEDGEAARVTMKSGRVFIIPLPMSKKLSRILSKAELQVEEM